MTSIFLAGDSQSVNPGGAAERALRGFGYATSRVSNIGMGPYDYVRISDLWRQYTNGVAKAKPALIVLIFGTNDAPNQHLEDALAKLKNSVKPKVILSGPPQYPNAEHQVLGASIKAVYAKVFGVDYFDSYPFTDPSLPRAADGLHLTVSGATPWGNAIAAEVVRRVPPR